MAAVATPVETATAFLQPKIVSKAFTLPLVTDAYNKVAKLSSPLQTYVDTTVASLSPILDSGYTTARAAGVEERIPAVVYTKLQEAKEQVAAVVGQVDTTLCAGLDTLVTKVPALKETTPALYASTKEAAVTYASQIATYLASFTLAQVVLKASDLGLETADSLLKLANSENCAPVVEGVKSIRGRAAVIRKEGAKKNGTDKVLAIEDASLLGAVVEVLGLNYLVFLFSLQAVINTAEKATEVVAEEIVGKKAEDIVEKADDIVEKNVKKVQAVEKNVKRVEAVEKNGKKVEAKKGNKSKN